MERKYFSYGTDAMFKVEEMLGEYRFDFDFKSLADEFLRYDAGHGFYLDIEEDDNFWNEAQKFELDSLDKEHFNLVTEVYGICAYKGDRLVWTPDYHLIDWDTLLRYFEEDICIDICNQRNFDEHTGTGRHDFLVAYCEAFEAKYDEPFDVWLGWYVVCQLAQF